MGVEVIHPCFLPRFTPYLGNHCHLLEMLQFSNFIFNYQYLLLESIPISYFPILHITCNIINLYSLFNMTDLNNSNIFIQANFGLNINSIYIIHYEMSINIQQIISWVLLFISLIKMKYPYCQISRFICIYNTSEK